jgi:dGTPase
VFGLVDWQRVAKTVTGYQYSTYASDAALSRGRLYAEAPSETRGEYQRDRDRIVHSTAFRRLKHKTQVFVYHEGDHYRTRLTHTLEVAQIARSMSRNLGLDEDLAEALALAHDLGHPPFGHAGERALARAMSEYGGFDHNAQTLRIITNLERRYAEFDGLNLTWETLEGIAKHNGPLMGPRSELGEIPEGISDYCKQHDLELATYASLEAQIAALADDIAYNSHDLDDGIRAGLINLKDMSGVPLVSDCLGIVDDLWPELAAPRRLHETLRRLTSRLAEDVIAKTVENIAAFNISSVADVRSADAPIVAFSSKVATGEREIKKFLKDNLYNHKRVRAVMLEAGQVVADLFAKFMDDPAALPEEWILELAADDNLPRVICNFVAGMTDRYALLEHARLFDHTPELR